MKLKDKFKVAFFLFQKTYQLQPTLVYTQILLAILLLLSSLAAIYFPSIILSLFINQTTVDEVIKKVLFLLVLLTILRVAIAYCNRKNEILKTVTRNAITEEISLQLLQVKYQLMEDPNFINQWNMALYPINSLGAIENFFLAIPKVIQGILLISSVIFILFTYQPILILVILGISLISLVLNRYLMKVELEESQISLKMNKEYGYYLRTLRDPIISKDIRMYQTQPFFVKKLKELFQIYIVSGEKLYGSMNIRATVSITLSILLLVLVYCYLLFASSGKIDASSLLLLINASTSLSQTINSIVNEVLGLNQSVIYLAEYHKFNQMVEQETVSGELVLEKDIETIEFKDVHFSYPSTEKEVLKGVNFILNKKHTLSIVGRNGSGKTTIIKLLTRLYEPNQGEILIDGIPLNQIEYKSYLKKLSVVFQDFKTFHYSIKENITFQDENEVLLERAIQESELEMELTKFSKGIDTYVSKDFASDGVQLSKGQEQKLAIARSIYRNSSVMILDEPTASLDPIAEEEVYKHFKSITKDNLSIFISHRLSSCKHSDRIIFLENGIITEEGTHSDLMKRQGNYFEMYTLQGSKYQESYE